MLDELQNKLMSGRIHYTIVKTSAHMVNNFKNGRYVLKHGYWLYLFEITARYDNEKKLDSTSNKNKRNMKVLKNMGSLENRLGKLKQPW